MGCNFRGCSTKDDIIIVLLAADVYGQVWRSWYKMNVFSFYSRDTQQATQDPDEDANKSLMAPKSTDEIAQVRSFYVSVQVIAIWCSGNGIGHINKVMLH